MSVNVNKLLGALLVLSSAQQVGLATTVISKYNNNGIVKNIKYTWSLISLILAVVGLILGLAIMLYDFLPKAVVIGALVVWLGVNISAGVIAQSVSNANQKVPYIVSYILTSVLAVLGGICVVTMQ